MLRRFALLLLSVPLLWFAHANLATGARDDATVSAAAIDAHDDESRITTSAPTLGTGRWAVMGPAMPAAVVAVPELHTAPVAVRDVARTVVPLSAASLHARRARHLASMRATSTLHRLDALWRADAQRLLAIPQYAIAPPLIG